MNLELENAQLKIQILELQAQLLAFHHREAMAHLMKAQEKAKASEEANQDG